jgi:hypothetical protein
VENAHSTRHAPEHPPKLSKESNLEPKLSFHERHQKLSINIEGLPPSPPQEASGRAGDEQKEPFPVIRDDCSVAASEITLDTCFRNQENHSHNSRDRSWSAFLGFGSVQQYQSTPPTSPSNQYQNIDRNSGFFGFGGYGAPNQGNSNANGNQQTPASLNRQQFHTPGRDTDGMEERGMDGSVSQQSAGVKPTRLQQQQASLLMRTQRSMRNSSANNTPLVDPLARPGSFRAMRNSNSNTPQSTTSPPVHSMSPPSNAVMMVNTGDSDALCDIYPNQDNQMFEEMKLGVHHTGKKGHKSNDDTFSGNNPAMKQMKNHSLLFAGQRGHSAMAAPSHSTSPSNSDFYISSTDEELGAFSTSNSISPKPSAGTRAGASNFTNPALFSRSQSTPIQATNGGNSYVDSPSVGKSASKNSAYREPYGSRKADNYELDMQTPMKKAYAAKAAQMARSGTAAGAAASAAVSKGGITNSGGDRPGAVQVSSTDESDMEFAIMLSLQEEQTRKQLEDAEKKAVEEAMQRSTINTRPSIRLLQSKYYNSR